MSKRPHMAKRIDRERLSRFAGMIADGMTITAASAQIGVTMQRGSQLWARIRKEMGEA